MFPELVALISPSTAEQTAWLSDWGPLFVITSLAIYEARLLLVYSSSVFLSFLLFHLSPVSIYLSENNTVAWKFYHAISSSASSVPLSVSSLIRVAYRESARTIEAAQPPNIIGLLSVVIYFQLAYLVGNNRKLGWRKIQRSHFHFCFLCIYAWVFTCASARPRISGPACLCVCLHVSRWAFLQLCECLRLSICSDPERLDILTPGSRRTVRPKWKLSKNRDAVT